MARQRTPARYKKGLVLTKDNKLVRLHGNMTPTSYKIVNYFLWKAVKEGRLEDLEVNAAEIARLLHIGDNRFGDTFKKECQKAAQTAVEIQDKFDPDGKWRYMTLVPTIDYDRGIITARVNPDVVPYIKELSGNFTPLELEKVSTCGTYPAMRLFEVCMSWKRAGQVTYTVEEWQGLLGATGKAYNVFSQFKRRVWEPAVKAVNERTSIEIKSEYIKQGRKTVKILVYINGIETVDVSPEPEQMVLPMAQEENSSIEVVHRMTECGLAVRVAQSFVKACGAEYCEAQLSLTMAGMLACKVKNPAAYLRSALEQDYAGERKVMERAKAAEKQAQKENAQRDREAWEMFHGKPAQEDDSVIQGDAPSPAEPEDDILPGCGLPVARARFYVFSNGHGLGELREAFEATGKTLEDVRQELNQYDQTH